MAGAVRYATALVLIIQILAGAAAAQTNASRHPTWWAKYQYLLKHASKTAPATTESPAAGDNVDLSNECGPQSEAFITYDPLQATLAAGSNEIFRAPMRGYFSLDGGGTWGAVDLPLPPPLSGTHATRFGSDPSLYTERSSMQGLLATKIPLMITSTELVGSSRITIGASLRNARAIEIR